MMNASAVSRVAGTRRNFEETKRFGRYEGDIERREMSEGEGEGVRDEVIDMFDARRGIDRCCGVCDGSV
jgi:hypothetical protein